MKKAARVTAGPGLWSQHLFKSYDTHSGLGWGAEHCQTFVILRGEVPGMPAYGRPSERERHSQQALTCEGLSLPVASRDPCTDLEENEAEWGGENFLSKGTCHSING